MAKKTRASRLEGMIVKDACQIGLVAVKKKIVKFFLIGWRGWGCPRIAEQIALAFGIDINKDVVRRILAAHYQPPADRSGPSWLAFSGHAKDSLHSIDLFRCESVALRTYWVLVVMDQYTRRIIGFGVYRGIVDGLGLCRMFKRAIRWQTVPKYLSSDHDPLYQFHQWQANLRVLGVTEIKTVPYVPMSHPFVARRRQSP
jgi:putative transposase